jgi:hypothetical protein
MNKTVEYLTYYNNFLSFLEFVFPYEETKESLNVIKLFSDEEKINKSLNFVNSFNDENFLLFIKKKLKVFSHKNESTRNISESLFGSDFCLKNLLNNQPEEIKNNIWTNLHTVYMYAEILKDEPNNERLLLFRNLDIKLSSIKEENEVKNKLHEMLDVDINEPTTNMINEIVASFEDTMKMSDGNPMSGIMELSQMISTKYSDKINSGEIELEKLLEAISKKIPGMDKIMSGVSSMTDKKEKKERVIMDENFSTALVEAPELKEDKSNFKIGDALKMADQMGVLGGAGGPSLPGFGDIMNMMKAPNMNKNGVPDMNKIMEQLMPGSTKDTDMNKMMQDMMKGMKL